MMIMVRGGSDRAMMVFTNAMMRVTLTGCFSSRLKNRPQLRNQVFELRRRGFRFRFLMVSYTRAARRTDRGHGSGVSNPLRPVL